MVVEYVRYRLDAAQRPEFEAAIERASAWLRDSPECVDYELTRCVDDPADHVLRISWTSLEDHVDGFRADERFTKAITEGRRVALEERDMRHYEPVRLPGTSDRASLVRVLVEYVRYQVPEAARAGFEEAFGRGAGLLDDAPECVDYELTRCVDDPGDYVVRIGWTGMDDYVDGWRESAAFARFVRIVEDYVPYMGPMRLYEPVGVQGKGGA